MAITEAQVALMLQGEPNGKLAPYNGYKCYRFHELYITHINQRIAMCTRWCQEQIATTTQVAKPLLFDDLVLYYTCYKIIAEDIMPGIMANVFSLTSIELTINNSSAPEVVTKDMKSYELSYKNLMMVLKSRVEILEQTEYGANPYDIDSYFQQTSGWRY